jgi:hypothetical protein
MAGPEASCHHSSSYRRPAVHHDVRRLIVDPALSHLTVNPKLALEFLAVFSRFEFALKVTTFRRAGEGEAKADWIAFANAVANSFNPNRTPELADAFAYLTSQPLRRFAVEHGTLDWFVFNLPGDASQPEKVVRLIRQVRNNLFHGGRFAHDSQAAPDRDSCLLEYSLVLLRELRTLRPDVEAPYVQ